MYDDEYSHDLTAIDIVELYGYLSEIESGYIKATCHPEDSNLVILNYTDLTTFERRWNKYTMSARGLILDLTSVKNNGKIKVLARPFEKFFNYGENLDYERDIDFNKVEHVMEKMDGSMVVSYFFKGEVMFATRGSFSSKQAIKAKEIWDNKYSHNDDIIGLLNTAYSTHNLIFEVIYPQNRIVVNYGDKEDLVLLGIIHNGVDNSSVTKLKKASDILGFPVAKFYEHSVKDMLEMKKHITANEEGWIVKFSNGKRLKIKGDEYLQVHKISYGMSDRSKVKAWKEDKMFDYIMMIPEEFREDLENMFNMLNLKLSLFLTTLENLLKEALENSNNRKEFAKYIIDNFDKKYHRFLFKAFDTKIIPIDDIKAYMYDNYRDLL